MYGPKWLRLLATEGERLKYKPRNKRGFASPGRPGSITVDLKKLRNKHPTPWEWQVWSHEWGHRIDGILGGNGVTGSQWQARPGFDDVPALWARAYGDTFDAAKQGGRAQRIGRDGWGWTGGWVDPYEGRIYSWRAGSKIHPDAAALADRGAGPVEFIAQAASYHAEHTQGWRDKVLSMIPMNFETDGFGTTHSKPLGAPGVAGRLASHAFGGGTDMTKLRTGMALYGEGWRGGLESLYGGGARFLREVADAPNLRWQGDGDVINTALLFRERYGVPLKQSIGPHGILRKHMADDVDLSKVEELDYLQPSPKWPLAKQRIQQGRAIAHVNNLSERGLLK